MEIKPPGPGPDFPSISESERAVNKTFTKQAETPSGNSGLTVPENMPLASALAGYQKADLQDPQKVEAMLTQCANGLLSEALGQSHSSLPVGESSYVAGWLQNDPSLRGKLLNYLERVLK